MPGSVAVSFRIFTRPRNWDAGRFRGSNARHLVGSEEGQVSGTDWPMHCTGGRVSDHSFGSRDALQTHQW